MKTELKVIVEIACLMILAIFVAIIANLIKIPCTYDHALLIVTICKVCRVAVELNEKK